MLLDLFARHCGHVQKIPYEASEVHEAGRGKVVTPENINYNNPLQDSSLNPSKRTFEGGLFFPTHLCWQIIDRDNFIHGETDSQTDTHLF